VSRDRPVCRPWTGVYIYFTLFINSPLTRIDRLRNCIHT